MHTAFVCSAVLEKLPVKVESIASWGSDMLLIGSADGHLLVYEVMRRAGGALDEFDLRVLDSHKGFGKKAVTQLSVLLRSNLLLSLSDGIVSVHDIGVQTNPNNGSRTPVISIRTQLKAKQAVLFALDTSTPECRLCVATAKKRLCFYRLAIGSKEFEDLGERPTPDVARSLVWAASKICVGYKKEYVLLDFKTGASQELFETGKLGAPIGAVINQQILLNKDNISIFYGFDGKPSRKYGIAWNEPPVDFGYAFPYVIGLLPSGVELSEEQKNCMLSELNKQKKKEL